MDHFHENKLFMELKQSCVSNSTTYLTNSTIKLLHNKTHIIKLEKQKQSNPKHNFTGTSLPQDSSINSDYQQLFDSIQSLAPNVSSSFSFSFFKENRRVPAGYLVAVRHQSTSFLDI